MSASARAIAAIAVCLVLALGGQALADSLVPEASGAETNRAVGRAATSYLTGLRTYAAAALWNRIDSLLHNYYSGVSLEDQRYMLSTIAAVQALDEHFIQSYYVGAWLLVNNDRVDEGIDMAERGVEANPRSGLLYENLAQVQMLFADDIDAAVKAAERALEPDIEWTDVTEEHNAYPILGAVFRAGGRADLDAIVQQRLAELDEIAGDSIAPEDHDHDHDGVPDH